MAIAHRMPGVTAEALPEAISGCPVQGSRSSISMGDNPSHEK
jgi:hypothetical protein